MDNHPPGDDEPRQTGYSNRQLGCGLAILVLVWFVLGVTYATVVNYGG